MDNSIKIILIIVVVFMLFGCSCSCKKVEKFTNTNTDKCHCRDVENSIDPPDSDSCGKHGFNDSPDWCYTKGKCDEAGDEDTHWGFSTKRAKGGEYNEEYKSTGSFWANCEFDTNGNSVAKIEKEEKEQKEEEEEKEQKEEKEYSSAAEFNHPSDEKTECKIYTHDWYEEYNGECKELKDFLNKNPQLKLCKVDETDDREGCTIINWKTHTDHGADSEFCGETRSFGTCNVYHKLVNYFNLPEEQYLKLDDNKKCELLKVLDNNDKIKELLKKYGINTNNMDFF